MGWLSGWSYRKSHTINGSTAGAQTNYQIRIKVHRSVGIDSGEDVYLAKYDVEQGTWTVDGNTYNNRLLITVTENSGTDLTDYQVRVVVNTEWLVSKGYATSTGNEVRFTDSDGSTLLDFWRENAFNQEETIYWVKVPNIPASGSKVIYMYFDPDLTGVSDASDADSTFIFCDDFLGASLDPTKWSLNVADIPMPWGNNDAAFQPANDRIKLYDGKNSGGNAKVLRSIDYGFYIKYKAQATEEVFQLYFFLLDSDNYWVLEWRGYKTDAIRLIKKESATSTVVASKSGYGSVNGVFEVYVAPNRIVAYYAGTKVIDYSGTITAYGSKMGFASGGGSVGTYGYLYAPPIIITKYVDPEPSVTVKTLYRCRTDFGDIRFTKSDKVTQLNYWIEEKVDGDYAIFWVKLDNIPASPNSVTIYLYYGNPSATTTSNGDDTFIFFDDFEGGTLEKWTEKNGEVIDDGTGNKVCRLTAEVKNSIKATVPHSNVSLEFKYQMKSIGPNGPRLDARIRMVTSRFYTSTQEVGAYDYGHKIRKYVDGVWTKLADNNVNSYTLDVWYNNYMRASGTSLFALVAQGPSLSATDSELSSGDYIQFVTWGSGNVLWLDDVRLRKYIYPEPSHGDWGSEETPAVQYYKTLTEGLGLADTVVKAPSTVKFESLGLSDAVTATRLLVKSLTELLGLSDVTIKSPSIVKAESLGLLDVYSRVWSVYRTYSELLGLADVVKKEPSKTFSESLGLLDCLTKASFSRKELIELLTFLDLVQLIPIHVAVITILKLAEKSTALSLTEKKTLLQLADFSTALTLTEKKKILEIAEKIGILKLRKEV